MRPIQAGAHVPVRLCWRTRFTIATFLSKGGRTKCSDERDLQVYEIKEKLSRGKCTKSVNGVLFLQVSEFSYDFVRAYGLSSLFVLHLREESSLR